MGSMMPWIGAAAGQAMDAGLQRMDQNKMMDMREQQDQRQERLLGMEERQHKQSEAIANIKVAMSALEITPDADLPKFVEHWNATTARNYPEFVPSLTGVRRTGKGEYAVQAHGGKFFRVNPLAEKPVEEIPGAGYPTNTEREPHEMWKPAQDVPGVGRIQTSNRGKESMIGPPEKPEKPEMTEAQAWQRKSEIAKTRATMGEPTVVQKIDVMMGLAKAEDLGKTITPESKKKWNEQLNAHEKYLDRFIGGGGKGSGDTASLKGEKPRRIYIKELDKTVLWDGQKVIAEKPGRFTGKF